MELVKKSHTQNLNQIQNQNQLQYYGSSLPVLQAVAFDDAFTLSSYTHAYT